MEIRAICKEIHALATEKGWWEKKDRNIGELIALCHSELSEALEDWRESKMKTYLNEKGKPCGFPSEIADTVIRLFDLCEALGIDLEKEIESKHNYNKSRSYRHGGKIA
jgi:NTP pyrophosphatase (non-canonical NTP hydrolase)